METREPVELLASTGDAAIDRIIHGVITIFEASLPARVRGYYLLGSYAAGAAVAISDIDLLPLFADALDARERAQAERLAQGCALLSPTRLDIILCDEATITNDIVLLKYGGLLVYGADTRASLPLPPLADYTRETLDAARYFMTRILRGDERLTYPLAYPDPTGEFYGYDTIRIPEWYPPETQRGMKELVTTATRMARASLALRARRYTGSKGGSATDYRAYIGDEWSDLLAALYTNGKLRWGYAVPADPDERRLLRDLCGQMLAFENDFLARYRVYLLGLLRAADASERAYARQKLAEVSYPDDEVRAALAAETLADDAP
jgi:hypothetical protein